MTRRSDVEVTAGDGSAGTSPYARACGNKSGTPVTSRHPSPDDAAVLHRPTDRDTLRAAVHELRSRGLTLRDVERALRLHPTDVADLAGADHE